MRLIGIAKPIEPLRAAIVLTPTTWPPMSTSGPPEFPGFTAASVWMKSKPGAAAWSGAPFRLTIPSDTVCSSPKGCPSASTSSPTARLSEFPSGSTGSGSGASILTSARSTRRSRPTTVPVSRRPDASRTWTDVERSTTWAFVTTYPLG